jgi:hypothetical protein
MKHDHNDNDKNDDKMVVMAVLVHELAVYVLTSFLVLCFDVHKAV